MPFYKTTENIFKNSQEFFDPNWMDSDKVIYPETNEWDYSRELSIEDVDIWEVLGETSHGVYAAYLPFAEFYLIVPFNMKDKWETYYGAGANKKVARRMKELNMWVPKHTIWVEPDDMWLYE